MSSSMHWQGRRVLITGGSTGIGLALATELLARGASVIVCSRSAERLAEARAKVPGLLTHVADVAAPAEVDALFAVLAKDGPLDVVINNAAVSYAPVHTFDTALSGALVDGVHVQNELAVNAGAGVLVTQRFLAQLPSDKPGLVVVISSPAALAPGTSLLYAASKAALHAFTVGLRHQLRATRVRVVEVFPPAVDTALNPLAIAKISPADFARRALEGLERGGDVVDVGPVWVVRWLARLWPWAAIRLIERASRPG